MARYKNFAFHVIYSKSGRLTTVCLCIVTRCNAIPGILFFPRLLRIVTRKQERKIQLKDPTMFFYCGNQQKKNSTELFAEHSEMVSITLSN